MSRGTDLSSTWVHYTGEPIGPVGSNRSDGHRVKLFEESVTFIAQLHPDDQAAMVPPMDRTWMIGSWPVHEYQIPIIVGISSGILVLLLLIAVLVAWRCCHIHRLRDKAFVMHAEGGRTPVIHSPSTGSYPSVMAMSIVSPSKPNSPSLAGRNQLASNSCELLRLTADTPDTQRRGTGADASAMTSMAADVDLLKQAERHSCEDMSLVGCGNYIAFDIPSFYEESLNTSSMSASSNAVLDVSWSTGVDGSLNELKTRSLPGWARNKGSLRAVQQSTRPVKETGRSIVVQPATNGSKRCHPNAGSALIALNKTTVMTEQQEAASGNGQVLCDRVSLVGHNEAVIVFNERTAL